MTTIQVPIYHCHKCQHNWLGRLLPQPGQTEAPKPLRCPKCGSPNWDKPRPVAGRKGK